MPLTKQKRIAKHLESLGADIIVGNTGYTIQSIEMINDTLVCYSLGNLLSGHYAADSRISAMIDFDLDVVESSNEKRQKQHLGNFNPISRFRK